MKKLFAIVSILTLQLTSLSALALPSQLSQYVGQYQTEDRRTTASLLHESVQVGMGATAIDEDQPIIYKVYDYYSFRVRDQNGDYNTSEIDIFLDQVSKIAIVCSGNHIPREVEAGKLFVYNQACQSRPLVSKSYSYIEKKLFVFSIGISLSLLPDGNIELTGYDVEAVFSIPRKQIKEKTIFLQIN